MTKINGIVLISVMKLHCKYGEYESSVHSKQSISFWNYFFKSSYELKTVWTRKVTHNPEIFCRGL